MEAIEIVDKALSIDPNASNWARKLGLHKMAINMAKYRGTVSPTIAYSLADEIGEPNPEYWALLAAAETERDSACKQRMLRKLQNWRKR